MMAISGRESSRGHCALCRVGQIARSFSQLFLNTLICCNCRCHRKSEPLQSPRHRSRYMVQLQLVKFLSYNSARDELFLADFMNEWVRVIECATAPATCATCTVVTSTRSVCYMSDSDTLLVCSLEKVERPDQKWANWLVALSREGSEWREAQRVRIDGDGHMCCALSDSRVLVGEWDSTYMELFRVESGPILIARLCRIDVPKKYRQFQRDERQRHARGDVTTRLTSRCGCFDCAARARSRNSRASSWSSLRHFCGSMIDCSSPNGTATSNRTPSQSSKWAARDSNAAANSSIAARINVLSWCAVDDGLAIFDANSRDLLVYSWNIEQFVTGN